MRNVHPAVLYRDVEAGSEGNVPAGGAARQAAAAARPWQPRGRCTATRAVRHCE